MADTPLPEPTVYTCKLTGEQGESLMRILREKACDLQPKPHAHYFTRVEKVSVTHYRSGKLVVQGRGTGDFVRFVLEPHVLGEARLDYREVHDPGHLLPRLGVDESGKGDFFGPLCIAGVYVNEAIVRLLEREGIQDSKRIGSDTRIARLARTIRSAPGVLCETVVLTNRKYNSLQAKMRNLDRVLAWGHARVIENLLERSDAMDPPASLVIIDQFARRKSTVGDALMPRGKRLRLVQHHKGEADMAVAAASILARHQFVGSLARMEKEFGLPFPKGASSAVDEAGREFVRRHGTGSLERVCKLHFKNRERITRSEFDF